MRRPCSGRRPRRPSPKTMAPASGSRKRRGRPARRHTGRPSAASAPRSSGRRCCLRLPGQSSRPRPSVPGTSCRSTMTGVFGHLEGLRRGAVGHAQQFVVDGHGLDDLRGVDAHPRQSCLVVGVRLFLVGQADAQPGDEPGGQLAVFEARRIVAGAFLVRVKLPQRHVGRGGQGDLHDARPLQDVFGVLDVQPLVARRLGLLGGAGVGRCDLEDQPRVGHRFRLGRLRLQPLALAAQRRVDADGQCLAGDGRPHQARIDILGCQTGPATRTGRPSAARRPGPVRAVPGRSRAPPAAWSGKSERWWSGASRNDS